MEKNNEYYNYILKQFVEAMNYQIGDFSSPNFMDELSNWINMRYAIGDEYLNYLFEIFGKDFIDSPNTFEVGKGRLDSVVKNLHTTLITPYSLGNSIDKGRIIHGELGIKNGLPYCYNKKGDEIVKGRVSYYPHNFMTHNPYTVNKIFDWESLRNGSINNVIVGVYGNKKEHDIYEKIKMLKNFRDMLSGSLKEEYITDLDNYYYIVGGVDNRKNKKVFTK